MISELHRQQTILLYSKTRSIPDRIVNLVQRHVRPIVRGKARAAVEFGAKISVSVRNGFAFLHRISWDPFNESDDLIPQAKKYKQDITGLKAAEQVEIDAINKAVADAELERQKNLAKQLADFRNADRKSTRLNSSH